MILHEEAEDGNAMPNLEQPVRTVSVAVSNLVKVGRETINSSDDAILRQDMPAALVRVEKSSKLLEEASGMLKQDPFSGPARKRLIEGSGGILQVEFQHFLDNVVVSKYYSVSFSVDNCCRRHRLYCYASTSRRYAKSCANAIAF